MWWQLCVILYYFQVAKYHRCQEVIHLIFAPLIVIVLLLYASNDRIFSCLIECVEFINQCPLIFVIFEVHKFFKNIQIMYLITLYACNIALQIASQYNDSDHSVLPPSKQYDKDISYLCKISYTMLSITIILLHVINIAHVICSHNSQIICLCSC